MKKAKHLTTVFDRIDFYEKNLAAQYNNKLMKI